jgi:phytoene desaturase
MHEASAPTFLYDESPSLGRLVRFGLRHGRTTFPRKKLPQLLDYFGAGPELKQFFLRFATYFGADPFRAPAILHNIAWAELGMGVYYPVGGVAALVGALTDLALELGVEIRTAEPVTRIVHRGGRVEAVSTEQAIYRADAVISALDIVTTHQLLGIPSHLTSRELSLSGFILLLALRGGAEVVRHHSVSFSSAYEAEFQDIREGRLPRDPTLYLNVSARTDPSDAPQGGENWFVMANAPARGDPSNTRQAGDEAAYADHLLAVLEHRGFEVRSAIAHSCYLGPRHLSRFGHKGSIYGVAPHSLTSAIRPKQTIAGLDGLVLAGGTVHPGGGVPLAVLSGRHAAATSLRGLGHPGSL